MPVTGEQKERKNEMRRLNRARKKAIISPEPEEEKEQPEESPEEPDEDPEITRKRAIADKRRASLALARSKIKPKSQITKEKDDEIAQIKEENSRLKELAKKEVEIPEIVPKKVAKVYNTPVRQRPKKEKVYQQPQQIQQQPPMDYLVNQVMRNNFKHD